MSIGAVMSQDSHHVTIQIHNNSNSIHAGEDFYLTGSFNSWQPAGVYVGKIPEYGASIEVRVSDVPTGLFEYKFTRGTWNTLASTARGTLEGPLKALINGDTVLTASIEGWRDDFPLSTASPQVHVLDTAFYFPKLNLTRQVWIYLPKDYHSSTARYPVIYMHDGQDLFDEATSKGRNGPLEWCVDETIDQADTAAIVVAIAHAGDIQQRQNEYFVRPNHKLPHPVGARYLDDIVHVLKPHVDNKYRTKQGTQHTAMVGSSVGGLLTFYAGLLYPDVFGTLGVLSPSVWLDEGNIEEAVTESASKSIDRNQRYFFYGGGNENRLKEDGSRVQMHDDIRGITALLHRKINPDIELVIHPEGRHGAWYWRQAFPHFFEWWTRGQAHE